MSTIDWRALGARLRLARREARLRQEDVARALEVTREMVSHWEAGRRKVSALRLRELARFYGQPVSFFYGQTEQRRLEIADQLPSPSWEFRRGLSDFHRFLEDFNYLLSLTGRSGNTPRLPESIVDRADRVRDPVKAADMVRAEFGCPRGPFPNLWALLDEELRLVVYRAPLGSDLSRTVSGLYLNHADLGPAIMINTQTTPARRRFTLAHELGHALFHTPLQVVCRAAGKSPVEMFADRFAGHLLLPTSDLRRILKQSGPGNRPIPEFVVLLQQKFRVSFLMVLVRLLQEGHIDKRTFDDLRQVDPIPVARHLGLQPTLEQQREEEWADRMTRFPPRFLALVWAAVRRERIGASAAADILGISIEDVLEYTEGPQRQAAVEHDCMELRQVEE